VQDEAKFRETWWDLHSQLKSFAAKRVNDDDADELVYDLTLLAFQHFRRFETEAHLRNWAYRSLRWRIHDKLLEKKLSQLAIDVPASEPSDEESSSSAATKCFREVVDALPRRQKEVTKRSICGESTKEIAKAMAITEASVRSLRRFARSRMVSLLMNQGENP